MNILCLIPARGGSKRVPGKNIRMLGGMPLITWTIKAAQESGVVGDIIVSTDEREIAKVAQEYGASVPGLRPLELASDTSSSVDVALHALDQYEAQHDSVDGLLLLQPTSPFRSASTICRAVAMFEAYRGVRSVVSVKEANPHPAWCVQVEDGNEVKPLFGWDKFSLRSQDLEKIYALNGAVYLVSPEKLRTHRRFMTPDSVLLPLSNGIESIDIDTELDWQVAETVLRSSLYF